MLVGINGLNLLPVFPFDGGRFLVNVLFSGSKYSEAVFKSLAGGALVVLAVYSRDVVLGIVALGVLISIPRSFKIASLREELRHEQDLGPDVSLVDVPQEALEDLVRTVLTHFPRVKKPKALAELTSQLWDRLRTTPPNPPTAVGLISLYAVCWAVTVLCWAVSIVSFLGTT
jgi:hypothetical protein